MVWLGGPGIVYGMAWQTWHGMRYGLAGMSWYMLWLGGHGMLCIVLLGGPGMVYYVLAGMAWYMVLSGVVWHAIWCGLAGWHIFMVWRAWHGKWYAWWVLYMIWPGDVWHSICYCLGVRVCRAWQSIWYGLVRYGAVYGMAFWAWHGISLRGLAWYRIWPSGHGMAYGMALRYMAWYMISHGMAWFMVWPGDVWHGILYGLAGMAWYMIRPGEVWHGMWKCWCEFYVLWHCLGLCSRAHVEKPMSVGGPIHRYRTHSQVEGLLHACSVHMYSSCSLWAVTVIMHNIYITVLG